MNNQEMLNLMRKYKNGELVSDDEIAKAIELRYQGYDVEQVTDCEINTYIEGREAEYLTWETVNLKHSRIADKFKLLPKTRTFFLHKESEAENAKFRERMKDEGIKTDADWQELIAAEVRYYKRNNVADEV